MQKPLWTLVASAALFACQAMPEDPAEPEPEPPPCTADAHIVPDVGPRDAELVPDASGPYPDASIGCTSCAACTCADGREIPVHDECGPPNDVTVEWCECPRLCGETGPGPQPAFRFETIRRGCAVRGEPTLRLGVGANDIACDDDVVPGAQLWIDAIAPWPPTPGRYPVVDGFYDLDGVGTHFAVRDGAVVIDSYAPEVGASGAFEVTFADGTRYAAPFEADDCPAARCAPAE